MSFNPDPTKKVQEVIFSQKLIKTTHPLIKGVFTPEISSRDETRPRMKSSLSMMKCLLLFTCCCQDEISTWDELIPVKKTGVKFHPGTKKKEKNTCKHLIQGWNFKMSMFFFNFWTYVFKYAFSKLKCLNIMGVWM